MKLHVKRLDREGRYETLVVRGDGVRFHVRGSRTRLRFPTTLRTTWLRNLLRSSTDFGA